MRKNWESEIYSVILEFYPSISIYHGSRSQSTCCSHLLIRALHTRSSHLVHYLLFPLISSPCPKRIKIKVKATRVKLFFPCFFINIDKSWFLTIFFFIFIYTDYTWMRLLSLARNHSHHLWIRTSYILALLYYHLLRISILRLTCINNKEKRKDQDHFSKEKSGRNLKKIYKGNPFLYLRICA